MIKLFLKQRIYHLTFDDDGQCEFLYLSFLTDPVGEFVFVGPVQGRPPLSPGEMGHALPVLLIALLMLLLLGFDGLLVFFHLVLLFHVAAPLHHLTGPLLREKKNYVNYASMDS